MSLSAFDKKVHHCIRHTSREVVHAVNCQVQLVYLSLAFAIMLLITERAAPHTLLIRMLYLREL